MQLVAFGHFYEDVTSWDCINDISQVFFLMWPLLIFREIRKGCFILMYAIKRNVIKYLDILK